VSYQEDNSLAIEWSFPSADCQLLSTGVWIRVFESEQKGTEGSFLYIANDCQTRNGDVPSVVLPTGDQEEQESQCSFKIPKLIECELYTVDLAVAYDSFQGRMLSSQVIVPPKLDKDMKLGPLTISTVNSTPTNLEWEDRTGCAAHLTSITLRIYADDLMNSEPISSLVIPDQCVMHTLGKLFSLSIFSDDSCSLVDWQPLDHCRTYRLEMEAEYWNRWKGLSSSLQLFTVRRGS